MSTQDQSTTGTGIEDPTPADTESVETETSEAEAAESEPAELSLDLIFEILKNSRRREVLHYLRELESDERVSLGELAEHVAAIENDTTTEALTSSERKRVYVGLYQCHLPKMDDMGVVEFNQDRGHVRLAPAAEHLMEYLDRPSDEAIVNWHQYYAVVSGIGVAILGLSAVMGFSDGVLLTLLGLVVATFAFCSGIHWLVDSQSES